MSAVSVGQYPPSLSFPFSYFSLYVFCVLFGISFDFTVGMSYLYLLAMAPSAEASIVR